MSVDQELARAVEEAEAEAVPAVAQPAGAAPPPPVKPKRNLGLLAGLLVIVAAILGLVFTSFKGAAIYSVGVDQLVKDPARYGQRSIRVKGMLVKGTLARRDEPCEYRFRLIENGSELNVQHPSCVVPDTFKDMPGMDVEVQAEGKMSEDGKSFVSTAIVAKCPSKYEMKQKSMAGELAPHAGQQASPLQTLSQKD
ncbi:MAG TPA: cytochrome c maturation protein CcmE [Polyangiaceae bacterium]|nr:cytochrome c maturation protein CcmE [Polyangiaceae bacterium]